MAEQKGDPRPASRRKRRAQGREPLPASDKPAQAADRTMRNAGLTGPRAQQEQRFADAVTVLEIANPEGGGVREVALPGDRSLSPPSPPEARRSWEPSLARRAAYVLLTLALTLVFVFVLVDVVRVG